MVGAVIALLNDGEGAAIGLVVSALILVLGTLTSDSDKSHCRPRHLHLARSLSETAISWVIR